MDGQTLILNQRVAFWDIIIFLHLTRIRTCSKGKRLVMNRCAPMAAFNNHLLAKLSTHILSCTLMCSCSKGVLSSWWAFTHANSICRGFSLTYCLRQSIQFVWAYFLGRSALGLLPWRTIPLLSQRTVAFLYGIYAAAWEFWGFLHNNCVPHQISLLHTWWILV